jgi:hypothetical protein
MLEEYLSQKRLVDKVLTFQEIEKKISKNKTINIMMGQTYDYGQPINLLKYSLFIINLQNILKQEGVDSKSSILLADHFMTDFNKEMSEDEAYDLGKKREYFLKEVNKKYSGNIDIIYSSKLSKTEKYKGILDILEKEKNTNTEFRETILKAVPEKKRNNPDALKYPFEEIACVISLDTDIKIGPKYEIFYDKPARNSSDILGMKRFSAIHLSNSYLLGIDPVIDQKIKNEIDEFGILPYQIKSKNLQDYRIDLGNLDVNKLNGLIDSTINKKSLLDILVISELAKQCLEKKPNVMFYSKETSILDLDSSYKIDYLKEQTKSLLNKYVISYFQNKK